MTDEQLKRLKTMAAERDEAFIDYVMTGSEEKLDEYLRKYKIPMPRKAEVKAAGVYKAVQECTMIPEEVKQEAMRKCVALGFSPTIWGGRNGS